MATEFLPVVVMDSTDALPAGLKVGQLIYYRDLGTLHIYKEVSGAGRQVRTVESILNDIAGAAIADGAVEGDKLAAGVLNVSLLAGQDGGSDPTYALTGGTVASEVVFVGHISTAASIATLADVTADFSFSAPDVLTDGGPTDYSNDQLLVIWILK